MRSLRHRLVVFGIALLLAGCASRGFESQIIEGGEGQDIEVEVVGVDAPHVDQGDGPSDAQVTLELEVSNNSEHDVTIRRINVAQTGGAAAIRLGSSVTPFKEIIGPGGDQSFQVRMPVSNRLHLRSTDLNVVIRTIVILESGESYSYAFRIPSLSRQ